MPADKISRPFEYNGYTEKTHKGFCRTSTYVGMSDGAQIAADIYLPEGFCGEGASPQSFPTIVCMTPYKRAILDPVTGEAVSHVRLGPLEADNGFPDFGYAIVIVDTRNNGASYGPAALTYGWRYQQDLGEVIDWIATQDWCDGNVGMMGGSHLGWTQLAAASCKPKALKAIMPAVVPIDTFSAFFPGGIFMQSASKSESLSDKVLAAFEARKSGCCASVNDVPLPAPGNSGHPSVPKFDFAQLPFIDTKAQSGESLKDTCANLLGPISESAVPIYNWGGWFDGGARGTCQIYATLEKTNPSRLAMFPGFHDMVSGFVYDEFHQPVPDLMAERRRFFDHYLRGVDNGFDREPKVLINVMPEEGWRLEREWPLARERREILYAEANNQLVSKKGTIGVDCYDVRLDHNRRFGGNLSNRWIAMVFGITPEGIPDMTHADQQCLVYTTAPLSDAKEVTGHPIAKLWVSSSAADADFYVYLEDVDPNGRPLMIAEGQLRAGFAVLRAPNSMTDTGIDIKPKLPWHGFAKKDWHDGILAQGAIIELVIDLTPVSWVFKEGHAIRISVACANWPDFALNPTLSPENNPASTTNQSAQVFIHRGGVRATSIDLPIIPR